MIEHRSEELTIVNPSREDGHVGSCPNGEGISLIKEEDMRSAAFEEGNGIYFISIPLVLLSFRRQRMVCLEARKNCKKVTFPFEESLETMCC